MDKEDLEAEVLKDWEEERCLRGNLTPQREAWVAVMAIHRHLSSGSEPESPPPQASEPTI